ncbi:retrovirus-related pol polyprotein from transposon TNT 1-94 [Tanacetum coccineum]
MANLSEDIQCAGSDTRPPMLDRTDFASWQQRIRLYCRGKENGVNILKSIDEGPFQMGTFWETLAEGNEGALHLGPERPRVYSDLSPEDKERVRNANPGQARQVKCYDYNGIGHIARNCTQPKHPQISEYFKDKMLLMQAQENEVALDEEQLLFIADTVYDEAGPSYDSDILFEVHGHDQYQDAVCKHHEEHEMHDDVQPNYIVDSHANYTSDSNMIPYDQYVKDNAVPVVQSNVSSIPNDSYMIIFNDMHEPHAQYVSDITQNTVVDNSLTAELATYKEQVELYERLARFELIEREQKIDEQLTIVITDCNI